MKRGITFILIFILLMSSCGGRDAPETVTGADYTPEVSEYIPQRLPRPEPARPNDPIERKISQIIESMTLREQVEQLFIINIDHALNSGGEEDDSFITYQPGGYILFAGNISTAEGTRALINEAAARLKVPPFICIDEEGGLVSRLTSGNLKGYVNQPKAGDIGKTGEAINAYNAGAAIGKALSDLNINVDFAPVADVLTNPKNKVIGSRAFGSEPLLVAEMVSEFQRGLEEYGVMSAPKHFPGHGDTSGDSHDGYVYSEKDAQQLRETEYLPFIRAMAEGAEFIMMGHITFPNTDGSGLPASLSPYFATDVLRDELKFEGIAVTDAMNMGAVTRYGSAEAAVLAVRAGLDMVLMPEDYEKAVEGVIAAVERGEITPERIRESLVRILKTKINAGMIEIK